MIRESSFLPCRIIKAPKYFRFYFSIIHNITLVHLLNKLCLNVSFFVNLVYITLISILIVITLLGNHISMNNP